VGIGLFPSFVFFSSFLLDMPRCAKGTRRNPKTGKCEAKLLTKSQTIKKACSLSAHPCAKKDAVKMTELRHDTTNVHLTPANISALLDDSGLNTMMRADIREKLVVMEFNEKFSGDFYEPLDANRLWQLTCRYGKNIPSIKKHLLIEQARSYVSSVAKGFY